MIQEQPWPVPPWKVPWPWRGDIYFGSECGMRIHVSPDTGSEYVDAAVLVTPSDEGDVGYFQVAFWKRDGSVVLYESNRMVIIEF